MTEEQIIVKEALKTIAATGTNGALKSMTLDGLRTPGGLPLTPEQQGVVWSILTGRKWIVGHIEPLWHNTRWCVTPQGAAALELM